MIFYLNINLIDMPVFLCTNNNITNCYRFESFIEADKYFNDNINNNIFSTMLFVSNNIVENILIIIYFQLYY